MGDIQQIEQDNRASIRSQQTVLEKRAGKIAEKINLQALKVEMVPTADLKPNPYNPNRQRDEEFALLRQSIRSDGFTMPILANNDLTIIDGEHRWQAALAEGLKMVPVVKLDLDEARMKIATIRHNKATGSHDAGLEAKVLEDLEKLMGRDFIERELMIDTKALDEILNFTTAADMLAGEDSIYEVNDEGEPEVTSTFKARKSVDAAIVLRSATEGANSAAYNKVEKKDKDANYQNLYTLSAIFTSDEAIVIQGALENVGIPGNSPAERLLYLARLESAKPTEENAKII